LEEQYITQFNSTTPHVGYNTLARRSQTDPLIRHLIALKWPRRAYLEDQEEILFGLLSMTLSESKSRILAGDERYTCKDGDCGNKRATNQTAASYIYGYNYTVPSSRSPQPDMLDRAIGGSTYCKAVLESWAPNFPVTILSTTGEEPYLNYV
jgi:hypothetical protein